MEKASEVYNKLKLRFVGKTEAPAKPKTEDKEAEDDGKESQNIDNSCKGFLVLQLFLQTRFNIQLCLCACSIIHT